MKKTKLLFITCLVLIMTSFTGCTLIDKGMVKLGFRNDYFNYIKENKVDKIVIQNARDSGFKFVVTDKNAINDIYDILSNGEERSEKSSLDPDYVFEIHMGEEVKSYNYVVGTDERKKGNFYNDEKIYQVSKNLDETIIQNLSFIRKPRDFETVYYDSILKVLESKKTELKDQKVGIDTSGDVDCLKYMFSTDLSNFEEDIKGIIPNGELYNRDVEDYDTIITVKNKGYNSKIFKTHIIVDNKKEKIYENYYVQGDYEYKSWEININEANKVPDKW
ncbi:MAG: hypothetical protein RR515_02160 [Clostridium sp.]